MTSGLLRTVVPGAADFEGLILLVESSACHRGSGGDITGSGLWAVARGAAPPSAAPAPAGAPSPSLGQGAGPATTFVSYLMTSTGQPSAAILIDGVSGDRKSGLSAGGRIRHVVSVTSNTSGQSFSHASQTMQPGAIHTLVTTSCVSAVAVSAISFAQSIRLHLPSQYHPLSAALSHFALARLASARPSDSSAAALTRGAGSDSAIDLIRAWTSGTSSFTAHWTVLIRILCCSSSSSRLACGLSASRSRS